MLKIRFLGDDCEWHAYYARVIERDGPRVLVHVPALDQMMWVERSGTRFYVLHPEDIQAVMATPGERAAFAE